MRKTVTELTYNNLDDFFSDIVEIKGKLNRKFMGCSLNNLYNKYVFRGESSTYNYLIPSVLRPNKEKDLCRLSGYISPRRGIKTELDQIKCEDILLRKFYSRCDYNGLKIPTINRLRYHNRSYDYSSENDWLPEDYFELAGLAQHYGLPTRLLDWSFNFFTALYFSLRNTKIKEEYCSVWAFNYSSLGDYFVSRPAKLKVIIPEYSQNPNLMAQKGIFTHWQIPMPHESFSDRPVDRRPLNELFESQIRADDTTDFSELFFKINIPIKYSKDLHKYIYTIGFDASTLFPGYDGITRSIIENGKILKK